MGRASSTSGRCAASRGGESTLEQIRPKAALAFDRHLATLLELVVVLEPLIGAFGHLDAPANAVRLHPAGRVHRVAPQVVDELRSPITPATTGPELIPIRSRSGAPGDTWKSGWPACISSAISATASA